MIIPELVNNKCKPDPAELSTATRFMSNENLRRSCEFIPMHHPYEWNPNKILNPIKNNTLSRISDNVSTKVTEVEHDRSLYSKKFTFKDPRARASELLQMNGIKQMDKSKLVSSGSTEQLSSKPIMGNYDISGPSVSYMPPGQSRYKVQL